MTKLSMNWWERLLFRDRGIIPTKRLLFFMLLLSIALFITTLWGVSWTFIFVMNSVMFLLSFIDLLFLPKRKQLSFTRTMPVKFERGLTYQVEIEVENNSPYAVHCRTIDGLPQSFDRPFPLKNAISENSKTVISYHTRAPVRGKYTIEKLYVRYTGRFGLWEKQTSISNEDTVKVIPDLTSTKDYLENAQRYLLYEGVQIRKQQSAVGEFSKIRNYVTGDDPRKINWRQTAKLQEVMTNEYEPEHGKYMTILVDCGRMMGAELRQGNRLERSLEAALTVTAAALQKGDYVSLIAFSKNVQVYVPPAKGMAHLQTIINGVYDLQADESESNYAEVLNYLQTVQKKRSFILLFSDVRTFLHEESALVYLKRLRQRHLFFMVGIEDETLLKKVIDAPVDAQSAMVKSMAQNQLLTKKREKNKWEKQGLQMVEAKEEKLASTAVSHYIQMMNRGLL
ncbi:DUF58 domain-containing protein [Salipaludibacillus sp. HK11]|uniref:DUF58 domain-containing protein n=1 Tax=Salipaludibacillus sp. HK11 TaxID=3394320 RepID=UPI0039FDC9CF